MGVKLQSVYMTKKKITAQIFSRNTTILKEIFLL